MRIYAAKPRVIRNPRRGFYECGLVCAEHDARICGLREIPNFNYTSHVQFPVANGRTARPQTKLSYILYPTKDKAKIQLISRTFSFHCWMYPFFIQTKVRIPMSGKRQSISPIRYAMRHDTRRSYCRRYVQLHVNRKCHLSANNQSHGETRPFPAAREQNFTASRNEDPEEVTFVRESPYSGMLEFKRIEDTIRYIRNPK